MESEIDYSQPGSVSDIKKRFNQTDYSRSIACPKNLQHKPLPPTKPISNPSRPLIVKTNDQSESSSGVGSSYNNNSSVNPFKTQDQAERHFILTTDQKMSKKKVEVVTRSRNTSGNGNVVRKSVSDMFDDALKTVTAVNSSSGISMRKFLIDTVSHRIRFLPLYHFTHFSFLALLLIHNIFNQPQTIAFYGDNQYSANHESIW